MGFTRFFRALLALAVVFAATMTASAGTAMSPISGPHHGASMKAGHCSQMPAPKSDDSTNHQDRSAKSCCTATCLGTAALLSTSMDAPDVTDGGPMLAMVETFRGLIAEIATPPPRAA